MKKVLFLLLLGVVVISGCSLTDRKSAKDILGPDEAKVKAEDYINNNLMQPGSKATVAEIVEENGLYKLTVDVGGQNVESYLTLDGKTFFPQAMETEPAVEENTADNSQPVDKNIVKSDKPSVELFIMSYCPYGTQIEKGIIPVVQTLGDKIDFQLEFVSYAMHGEKELKENLVQYCIQKEQSDKMLPYLSCFLKAGESDACLAETKVDTGKLNNCTDSTDKEYKVTELFKDQSTWSGGSYPQFNVDKDNNTKYGVQGSPTLVINGAEVSSGRDSASLLNTICSAFNNQPDECGTQLSSASPSAGFGFDASGGATDATCN